MSVGGARWFNNGYDFMEYAYLQVNKSGDVVTAPPAKTAGELPGPIPGISRRRACFF